MRALALGLALALLAACGGTPARPAPTPGGGFPVELDLAFPDGTFLALGDLRGRTVLLFVLTTFDSVSQASIRPLRCLVEARPDITVIGLAAEPSARQLVGPYADVLDPPFEIAFDPEDLVRTGESALGAIDVVPTFIVVDPRGFIARRYAGYLGCTGLQQLVEG
jgi:hypothetical protein